MRRAIKQSLSVAVAIACVGGCAPRGGGIESNLTAFEVEACSTANDSPSSAKDAREDDANVRAAAQKSLDFLTRETIAWQAQHQCMGCHVQGVTGEALSIGLSKQYEIEREDMSTVFEGLLTINGGVRTETGHAAHGGLRFPSRAFAGASLARYDQLVDSELSDDLYTAATDLLEFQAEDGSITQPYNNGVVAHGDLQGTYQAILTWNQAYMRSADDRWLTAIARSEDHLQRVVDSWSNQPPTDIQDVNYALLGLLAAGVGSSEAYVVALQTRLLEAQNTDGGWSYQLATGTGSTPLSTGQTLYTLRMLGMNDSEPAISFGIAWLLNSQNEDGGWSHSGAGKAEAMWAVLGLVATDVLSINVTGLQNGMHLGDGAAIGAMAEDNDGSGVARVEIAVDDVVVWGECGAGVSYELDADLLGTGPHTVDVFATNNDGKVALRRFMVYSGDMYLTQIGSDFSDGGTVISFRDVAPLAFEHEVELQIFAVGDDDEVAAEPTHTETQKGRQGVVSFFWKGEEEGGSSAHPEYIARLVVRDGSGEMRQAEKLDFVHQNSAYQEENYSQVSGQLHFEDAQGSANTVIELVDEDGRVVQSTRSTASGNYRFRNVKSKKKGKKQKYKVRVSKDGYKADEFEVAPAAGEDVEKDVLVY